MADSDKPAPANQTIQLDALDASEALKVTEGVGVSSSGSTGEGVPSRRPTPPPLPPSAFVSNPPPTPAVMTSRAPTLPPPRPLGQKVALVALFVVIIAGAIAGGLAVGSQARGKLATPAASSAAPGTLSPSASDNVLVLPTIEMSSQPAGN